MQLALVAVAALVMSIELSAQDTGYIGGTVTDKTGAAVAGAEVTLTNTAGSITRNTSSYSDGAFVVPGLPGDTYDLSVTA